MCIISIDSILAGYSECFITEIAFDFVVSDEEENDVVIRRKSNQVSVLCVCKYCLQKWLKTFVIVK